jgi:type I restriction enzyme M protein
VDKGWDCDLVPKDLVISRYFKDEQNALNALEEEKETIERQLTGMKEEHSGEDGCFTDLDKVNKGNINARLKELKLEEDAGEDIEIFTSYLSLMDNLAKCTALYQIPNINTRRSKNLGCR